MLILTILVSFVAHILVQAQGLKPTIIHVPLDQRFTTRVAFLNLVKITPFPIKTLPQQYLPSLKQYSPSLSIQNWFKNVSQSQSDSIGIVSIQTMLYGSLIASRISNDTLSVIKQRLNYLVQIKNNNPHLKLYCSAVVMRIPNYNADFEEPAIWAKYGTLFFQYSYYTDKYNKLKNQSDYQRSQQAKQKIPQQAFDQFISRRNRNDQILHLLLDQLKNNSKLFQALYITLDDNAEYGLNIAQADSLIKKVTQYDLTSIVKIYPGADQVAFSLLAKASVDFISPNKIPSVAMVWRNQSTIDKIPNYEGIALKQSTKLQIQAAGGLPINGSILTRGNITLLINNFDEQYQHEAPYQSQTYQVNYSSFNPYVCYAANHSQIIGFVDNRFSNGADIKFVSYMLDITKSCNKSVEEWGYAGWNTNGNTLGTVISNSMLLYLFKQKNHYAQLKKEQYFFPNQKKDCEVCSPCEIHDVTCANGYFNALRILQDRDWQALLRQNLIQYIDLVPEDNPNQLQLDLDFYTKFTYKSLNSKFKTTFKNLGFNLEGIYYPWNRTFQIGLYGNLISEQQLLKNQ